MPISKFDLYKSDWIELVFDHRNKEYGAYNLRQHYAENMIKVMCIAFLSIIGLLFIIGMVIKPVVSRIAKTDTGILVVMPYYHVQPPAVAHPRPISQAHHVQPASPAAHVNMQKLVPLVVSSTPVAIEPPKISDLKGEIGPEDMKALGTEINTGPANGQGTNTLPGNGTVYQPIGLQYMPEPVGGAAAWARFLQKNLNYPEKAIDQDKEGRVWLSFIVEKNGRLSDIKVDSGAGYGMDEEALRVLKLAPAWKPGIQNGQPVRVKYTIPINFQLEK